MASSFVAIAGGCYSPELRDCTITCTAAADCADGQVCGDDHFCAAPGIAGQCSMLPGDAGETIRDGGTDAPTIADAGSDATVWAAIEIAIEGQGRVIVQSVATCEKAGPQNGACMFYVPAGLAITVHAQPYVGWRFDKWTMMACNHITGPTCTFQATGTSSVGTKFRKDD